MRLNLSFLWAFSHLLPFFRSFHFCRFPLLLPSFHLLSITVYSNTAGCSEPLGMKSRLISDGQLSASSTFRTWGIDTFTWHPQFARLDKQGKTNAWSPASNNRSEWIQVSEMWTQVKCPDTTRHQMLCSVAELCSLSRWTSRRQNGSQASSLRGQRILGWCSSCQCLKSPTVMMKSRGVW